MNFWKKASLREKKIIAWGALITFCLLSYAFIWPFVSDEAETLRQRVRQDFALLTLMQEYDKRMTALTMPPEVPATIMATARINSIQNDLDKTVIAKNLSLLQQAEGNAIKMQFKSVNFDDFISWLIHLWQTQKITIKELHVTSTSVPGMVSVNVILG